MTRKTILPFAFVITLLLIVLECLSRFGAVHRDYTHVGVDIMIAVVCIGYQSSKRASLIAMTLFLFSAGAFPVIWFWLVPPVNLNDWPEIPYLISLRFTSCIVGCWLAALVFVKRGTDSEDGFDENTPWRRWLVGCMFLCVCVLSLFHFFCLQRVYRDGPQAMLLVPFASTLFSVSQNSRLRSFSRFVCLMVAFLLTTFMQILTQDLLFSNEMANQASWSTLSTAISLHKITGIDTWGRGGIDVIATFYGTVTDVNVDQQVIPLIIGQALTLLIFFICGSIRRAFCPEYKSQAFLWFKGLAVACSIVFLLQWGKTMQSHQDTISELKVWKQKANQIPEAWIDGDWKEMLPSLPFRSEYCSPVKRMLSEHSFQHVADGMINDGKFLLSVWFLASENVFAIYRETRKNDSDLPTEPGVWFEVFHPEFADQGMVLGTNTMPFAPGSNEKPFEFCYDSQFADKVASVLKSTTRREKSSPNQDSSSSEELETFLKLYPSSWDRQCSEWIKFLQLPDSSRNLESAKISFASTTNRLVDEFIARQLRLEFPELRSSNIHVSSRLSVVQTFVLAPEYDPEFYEQREVNLLGDVEFGVCQSGGSIHRIFKVSTPVPAVVYEIRKNDQFSETGAMKTP